MVFYKGFKGGKDSLLDYTLFDSGVNEEEAN